MNETLYKQTYIGFCSETFRSSLSSSEDKSTSGVPVELRWTNGGVEVGSGPVSRSEESTKSIVDLSETLL